MIPSIKNIYSDITQLFSTSNNSNAFKLKKTSVKTQHVIIGGIAMLALAGLAINFSSNFLNSQPGIDGWECSVLSSNELTPSLSCTPQKFNVEILNEINTVVLGVIPSIKSVIFIGNLVNGSGDGMAFFPEIKNFSSCGIRVGTFENWSLKKGIKHFANGDVHTGFFGHEELEQGTKVFASGYVHAGTFDKDIGLTKGTIIHPGGNIYTGFFGPKELEQGTIIYSDGDIQTGTFDKDIGLTNGTIIRTDGYVYKGIFGPKELEQGTIIDPDGKVRVGIFCSEESA